jgi:hypothetical protein
LLTMQINLALSLRWWNGVNSSRRQALTSQPLCVLSTGGMSGPPGLSLDPPAPVAPPSEDSEGQCVICANHLDADKHRPAVGPCDHIGICALCHLRMRRLMNDPRCSICKMNLENVYVFASPEEAIGRPYRSLDIWGENAGPGMKYDDLARMFMPKAFYQDVYVRLQGFGCPVEGCT